MLRRLASIGLSTSAIFLAVVAIMLNSPSLFYMGTALVGTIAACRLQAWLSVRGLRFERVAPSQVSVGDLVTVSITVWSEHRVRRPLITIWDNLPRRLLTSDRTPSMPVAPAFDRGIDTHYSFRPLKRGVYRWSGLQAVGTDALGLVSAIRESKTDVAELTVLPAPIPVAVDLPVASGWGISEAESGHARGAGLEPRGVREYVMGDSLRHVHWRSSARTGRLLVKEFEAGSQATMAFILQHQRGTDLGEGRFTSLELFCGHVAFLAEKYLGQGIRVEVPVDGEITPTTRGDRLGEIYESLARLEPDGARSVSEEAAMVGEKLPPGSTVYTLLAVADPGLAQVANRLWSKFGVKVVALVYEASEFGPCAASRSAADPPVVEALRKAGAIPVVMPGWGAQA